MALHLLDPPILEAVDRRGTGLAHPIDGHGGGLREGASPQAVGGVAEMVRIAPLADDPRAGRAAAGAHVLGEGEQGAEARALLREMEVGDEDPLGLFGHEGRVEIDRMRGQRRQVEGAGLGLPLQETAELLAPGGGDDDLEPGGTNSRSSGAMIAGASGSQFGARLYCRKRSVASAKSSVPSGPTRARAGSWKVVARPR